MENITKVIVSAGILFLSSLIIMLLWNWLMPILFGLIKISYWQALGIKILINNLTGYKQANYLNK